MERADFERLIQRTEGCWIWRGPKRGPGYGGFRQEFAHRASYRIFRGEITKNLLVCHHCDNKRCVRPEHLFLGTHADNTHDAIRKGRLDPGLFGRSKTHCKRGHPLSGPNVWYYNHRRYCRACLSIGRAKRYREKRGEMFGKRKPRQPMEFCKAGLHRLLPEAMRKNGPGRLCAECRRAYGRMDYRRRQLARAHAFAEPVERAALGGGNAHGRE